MHLSYNFFPLVAARARAATRGKMFGFEIFCLAPRDFSVLLVIHFLHSVIGFNLYSIVMWILTENCGFDDRIAGVLFALFGPVSSVYALLGGPLIDKLLIVKSLMLQTAFAVTGMLIMTLSLHPVAVCVALFGPIAMASAMNHTVILVALQRYIPDAYRTMAFSTKYVIMNVGAVVSSILVDVFRLYINPRIHFIAPWSFFLGCCVILQLPIAILIMCGIRDVEAKEKVATEKEAFTDIELESSNDFNYATIPEEDNFEAEKDPQANALKVLTSAAPPPSAAALQKKGNCCRRQRVDAWEMQPFDSSSQPQSFRELGAKIKRVIWDTRFWKFVLFSTVLLGAKTVFVYMYSLYPVYMKRAHFEETQDSNGRSSAYAELRPFLGAFLQHVVSKDTAPGDADASPCARVPFMMFTVVDPVIVIVLSWIVGWIVNKYSFERYWVILVGTVVGAGAPFFMMIPHYWAVLLFIIVMAIGESVWSPVYDRYIAEFTQRGDEGIFFGLATIPTTLGHMISTMSSGFLLEHFCSSASDCGNGRWIWFIAGCGALSTPLLLLASIRWTRLKPVARPASDEK